MQLINVDTIRKVLEQRKGAEIARSLDVSRSLIQRYKNGDSAIENMTLGLGLKFMEYAKTIELEELKVYDYQVSTIEYWVNEDYNEHWDREVFLTESADTRFEAASDEEAIAYVNRVLGTNLDAIKHAFNKPKLKNAIVYISKAVEFNKYGEVEDFEEIDCERYGFDEK